MLLKYKAGGTTRRVLLKYKAGGTTRHVLLKYNAGGITRRVLLKCNARGHYQMRAPTGTDPEKYQRGVAGPEAQFM